MGSFVSCQKIMTCQHITDTSLCKTFPLMQSQCSCASAVLQTLQLCISAKLDICLHWESTIVSPFSSQWPLLPGWSRWKVSAFNCCSSRGSWSTRLVSTYLFTRFNLPCPSERFFSRYVTWLNLQEQTLYAEKPERGLTEWDFALIHFQLSSKKRNANIFKNSQVLLR